MIFICLLLVIFMLSDSTPSKTQLKKEEQKRRKDLRYDIKKATKRW